MSSYECRDCLYFQKSRYDADKYGRRYCDCVKRYVEIDESAKYCRDFVYVSRYVLTKICTILNLPVEPWFKIFDIVKETYVGTEHPEWLTRYNEIGPRIADAMDADPENLKMAQDMMDKFINPAHQWYQNHEYANAAHLFRDMILYLEQHYT